MVVLSCLRPYAQQGARSLFQNALRNQLQLRQAAPNQIQNVIIRCGSGGGHTMQRKATMRYQFRTFRDDLHFYTVLGFIPVCLVIAFSNLVIGQAELSDIPEGYEPRNEEYLKHPIQRFFAKYVVDSPQRQYEKCLDAIHRVDQKRRVRQLSREISEAMNNTQDVRGFYYLNANIESAREKERSLGSIKKRIGIRE